MSDPKPLGLRVLDLERRVAELEKALWLTASSAEALARELKHKMASQP